MKQNHIVLHLLFLTIFCSLGVTALAQDDIQAPPTLHVLQTIEAEQEFSEDAFQPFDIRRDAIKNAALSYGARGGLAYRTYLISRELDGKDAFLDQTYGFNQLLIHGPSGLFIEPPIITEAQDALIIEDGGQTAAVAEMILNINRNARITSTARNWRTYLQRDWGKVSPPPDLLLPRNEEERKIWIENVEKGWDEGFEQADEIFEADLNRLNRDFQGMVRYRVLLAQNMVSPPFALLEERGITGGGDQMRIGDRAVQITGPSQLLTNSDEWRSGTR